jgi:hypothetical protein
MPAVVIDVLRVLGPVVFGYLLGGVPFGVIVTRVFFKADITALGSGNTGGTNVYRNFGWTPAIAVGLLDVAKAAVPTIAGFLLADPTWGPDARDWVAIPRDWPQRRGTATRRTSVFAGARRSRARRASSWSSCRGTPRSSCRSSR